MPADVPRRRPGRPRSAVPLRRLMLSLPEDAFALLAAAADARNETLSGLVVALIREHLTLADEV